MADAVAVRVIDNTPDYYVVHCTNVSDGTGEADVVKIDKSTLVAADGAEPASLDILKCKWNCDGMAVRVEWDHTTDDLALALSGVGEVDFTRTGAPQNIISASQGLKDPRSAGGAGDILFTTVGHTSGDTYNVTLWLRKNPD